MIREGYSNNLKASNQIWALVDEIVMNMNILSENRGTLKAEIKLLQTKNKVKIEPIYSLQQEMWNLMKLNAISYEKPFFNEKLEKYINLSFRINELIRIRELNMLNTHINFSEALEKTDTKIIDHIEKLLGILQTELFLKSFKLKYKIFNDQDELKEFLINLDPKETNEIKDISEEYAQKLKNIDHTVKYIMILYHEELFD